MYLHSATLTTRSVARVPHELSSYALNSEIELLEALGRVDARQRTEPCPRELVDAVEGVARTFPFDQPALDAARALDGLQDHAWEFDGDKLTVAGMAWVLPDSRIPFRITVWIDPSRQVVTRVDLALGEKGRDLTSGYTSKDLRYLEDVLRHDTSTLNWAHQATWTRT